MRSVIPYIHSHKGFFPSISMATITTFPDTSFIPEWVLEWLGEEAFPSTLCLAQTSQILQKLDKTFPSPTAK